METVPAVLETSRLALRPFRVEDGPRVRELAGEREIYENTLLIPHPYEEGVAEEWISTHLDTFRSDRGITSAVTLKENGEIIGAIGLGADRAHKRAELGYWIGVPYWGNGYCSEAARELLRYGFEELLYHRIFACHFMSNPASGRVMKKIGMKKEGIFKDHVFKDGMFLDCVYYGITNCEPVAEGDATH